MDDVGEVYVENIYNIVNRGDENVNNEIWKIFIYGSSSKEGSSSGIVLISPTKEVIYLSFKLEFEATNNVAEYEALFWV